MSEKSEVQNLTEPTVGNEALDATPPATDTDHVQHGEPKEYPRDADGDDGEPYATGQHPSS